MRKHILNASGEVTQMDPEPITKPIGLHVENLKKMKSKRNRGKQRNLDSKRSGECIDYKFKDTFFYSTDVRDWYESKSKIVMKAKNLF